MINVIINKTIELFEELNHFIGFLELDSTSGMEWTLNNSIEIVNELLLMEKAIGDEPTAEDMIVVSARKNEIVKAALNLKHRAELTIAELGKKEVLRRVEPFKDLLEQIDGIDNLV